jgi:demethylmenaquinone methyltransferase/2-methoxy-6-polyprenyl-1,4-benzoquinol methylase
LPTEPAWTDRQLDQPHADPDKARRVERMFAAIAPSYDLNNRVHSFGRDQAWRRETVRRAELSPGEQVIDVACGTGDLSLAFADKLAELGGDPPAVVGVDFTFEMLPLAAAKTCKQRADAVRYVRGDAMALPLPDACADVVSIAFGIRNVVEPARALAEFYRVLRPGGRLLVLEFTVPRNPLVRLGHDFYCGWVMPRTAALIAGDRSGAYRYLPRSVSTFTTPAQLRQDMQAAGFADPTSHRLTFGIAAIHRATKR